MTKIKYWLSYLVPVSVINELYPRPIWLRHITPWWFLSWLCNHFHWCWVDVVMWKMYGCDGDWRDQGCVRESKDKRSHYTCYCGKYQNGVRQYPKEATK